MQLEDLSMKTNDFDVVQPEKYSEEELKKLREFIEVVKNDESRSSLACWGNHSDYNKGY